LPKRRVVDADGLPARARRSRKSGSRLVLSAVTNSQPTCLDSTSALIQLAEEGTAPAAQQQSSLQMPVPGLEAVVSAAASSVHPASAHPPSLSNNPVALDGLFRPTQPQPAAHLHASPHPSSSGLALPPAPPAGQLADQLAGRSAAEPTQHQANQPAPHQTSGHRLPMAALAVAVSPQGPSGLLPASGPPRGGHVAAPAHAHM